MCFIPSHALGFKPWKHKFESPEEEPPKKKVKSMFMDNYCQTEFNKDIDCGSLCTSGDISTIENGEFPNDIAIQCCYSPKRSFNCRNFRLVVSRNQNFLEINFLQSDDLGFRWLESLFNFYKESIKS